MKPIKKIPANLTFLGYYSNMDFRLYRRSFRNDVKCYLIPTSESLFNFKYYEITKEFALFLLAGKL